MAILSNEARQRLAGARFTLDIEHLGRRGADTPDEIARRIVAASEVAREDPSRAITNNKGIMNGISALALATLNDTRAVEAAAHAWAARDGRIRGLATYRLDGRFLVGDLELPLPLGTVGGSTGIHPAARAALRVLGMPDAPRLARIAAALGLAQNLAALRALVTRGNPAGPSALPRGAAGVPGGGARPCGSPPGRGDPADGRDARWKRRRRSWTGSATRAAAMPRAKAARRRTAVGRRPGMSTEAVCRAGPSLALIKYWGKTVSGDNLPATPSLAVTLGGVYTETRVSLSAEDSVEVDGLKQDPARYAVFFDNLRHSLQVESRFAARSTNSFPASSGLASSSSGFAALAGACARATGKDCSPSDLSALARVGSASAARAVFAGFVLLPPAATALARSSARTTGPSFASCLRSPSAPPSRSPPARPWTPRVRALLTTFPG